MKILVAFLLLCSGLWAQSTAQISGTVKDPAGANVPDADVTATQVDTGLKRSVKTDANGAYTLPTLPVGAYRLEAAAQGFRAYVQTGIVLQVADNSVINPVLQLGQVTEAVEVEANAEQVETRNTGVSQVMDNARMVELPLNGRQVTDLVVLSGAATVSATTSFVRNYPTVNISVAGGLHDALTYMLDGASHNDPINGLNLALPFPDALQEFKLETSSLSAQYGQHSAGAVNAVTKSGSNNFHGDLFEFLRNGDLNARNFFAVVPDELKRNQFGGTVGGRIIKNKLFFFAGYQGTRIVGTVSPQFAYLPTPTMLAGNWSAVTSPACNGGRQITLKAPFNNNQISPSLFSPVAVALMNSGQFPVPTGPCGQVEFGIKPTTSEDLGITKVDYQISDKHSLFGRYEIAHLVDPQGYAPGNLLTSGSTTSGAYTTYPVDNSWQTQSFALGDTYLITSNMVSSFRAAVLRPTNDRGQPPAEIDPASIGISGITEATKNKILGLSVSGGFSIGAQGGNVPGLTNATAYQESEDISWVKGSHQIGFGVNNIHARLNTTSWTYSDGVFAFTAQNTGLGLGDFMLGEVNNYLQASVQPIGFVSDYLGSYVQDTWKITPRLTLNGGLRWDPYMPLSWGDKESFYFSQSAFNQGTHSTVYPNAPAGAAYSGDPGVPANGKTNPNQWWHFSPRLGLAYDPTGKGRLTIRAAYGLFRDYADFYESQMTKASPPFNSTLTLVAPGGGTAAGFADPFVNYPGGSPFPTTVSRNSTFGPSASWVIIPPNLPSLYVNQWNLSIQKQLGSSWVVSANYMGSEATHVLNSIENNPAVYIPGNCVAGQYGLTAPGACSTVTNTTVRRQLYLQNPAQGQYYGTMTVQDASGTLSYNALFLTATHRVGKGLTVIANYTWSHCLDAGTSQIIGAPSVAGLTPVASQVLRGNCVTLEEDRRHNFNMTTVYAMPQYSNRMLRLLVSGWQVSGIVSVLSGDHFSAAAGVDAALSGSADQRPQQVLANPYSVNKGVQWLNPAAFAQPATGTYANMNPGTLVGPGFFGINVNLTRGIRIREKQTLEFRAEAFNVLNRVNFLDPTTTASTLTSSTFGQIQTANDPRILQLALKYVF